MTVSTAGATPKGTDVRLARNAFLDDVKAYVPGPTAQSIADELGVEVGTITKLSSNEAPLGPATQVRDALHRVAEGEEIHRYPSSAQTPLKTSLAGLLGVTPEQVLLDAGSSTIWPHVVRAFSQPGDNALVVTPSFTPYEELCLLLQREVRELVVDYPFDYTAATLVDIADERTCVVFISSPNNTTSRIFPSAEVRKLAMALPGAVVLVDEHYIHAAPEPHDTALALVDELDNLVVTRTFSKMYGLAGLRVGYAIAQPYVIEQLNAFRGKWGVSIAAERAALAALEAEEHLQDNVATTLVGRQFLLAELGALPVEYVPEPHGGFVLLRPTHAASSDVVAGLRGSGVMIRDDLLEGWIRVSVGTPAENVTFIRCLAAVLEACR